MLAWPTNRRGRLWAYLDAGLEIVTRADKRRRLLGNGLLHVGVGEPRCTAGMPKGDVIHVQQIVQSLFLDLRQNQGPNAGTALAQILAVNVRAGNGRVAQVADGVRVDPSVAALAPGRKIPKGILKLQDSQNELLLVINTLSAPSRLARGLDRRQQQRHQDTDDRDDHQQFHQRKPHDDVSTYPLSSLRSYCLSRPCCPGCTSCRTRRASGGESSRGHPLPARPIHLHHFHSTSPNGRVFL